MRLLLDTHALLWYLFDSPQLSQGARNVIDTVENVFVSVASLWEIAIKNALGKLEVSGAASSVSVREIREACEKSRIDVLPIATEALELLEHLPMIHRDPFDRLLVAQAQSEGLTLVTKDENIAKYDVQTIWEQRPGEPIGT